MFSFFYWRFAEEYSYMIQLRRKCFNSFIGVSPKSTAISYSLHPDFKGRLQRFLVLLQDECLCDHMSTMDEKDQGKPNNSIHHHNSRLTSRLILHTLKSKTLSKVRQARKHQQHRIKIFHLPTFAFIHEIRL